MRRDDYKFVTTEDNLLEMVYKRHNVRRRENQSMLKLTMLFTFVFHYAFASGFKEIHLQTNI